MNAALMELGQIPMSPALAATLTRASEAAATFQYTDVTLEHLLLALCDDPDAVAVLDASRVVIAHLRSEVIAFLGNTRPPFIPQTTGFGVSADVSRILEAASAAARGGRRRDISGAIVLAAIVGDARSAAAQMLQSQGLTFDEAIRALQRALVPAALRDQQHAMLPADDVLARARERVQSRAAPSLRQLMYDAPRPPPPPPPLPVAATGIPSFGELAVPLPQLGELPASPQPAPIDRFARDQDIASVIASSLDEAMPDALGEISFPQVLVKMPAEPASIELPAMGDGDEAAESDVDTVPDGIDMGGPAVNPPLGLSGDADLSGDLAEPFSQLQTTAIDAHLRPLLDDMPSAIYAAEPPQAAPFGHTDTDRELVRPARQDGAVARSFYPPTPVHTAPAENAPSAGFIPRLEPNGISDFEETLPQVSAVPLSAPPAWTKSDATGIGLPTFATNRPIPIQPPPIPQPPPGTRLVPTFAPPGSFELGSRFPPMDSPPFPGEGRQRAEPALPNFSTRPAEAAAMANPRFIPSVPPPGQHHLPNAQPGVFEASLPSLRSPTDDFEFPQPPMPGPQLHFPPAAPDAASAPRQPRGRIPTPAPRRAIETSPGLLAENIPRTMRVAQPERIEIRIAKASITGITTGMSGGAIWQHDVTVTQAMSVRLRAPEGGFFIETVSPETMWIDNQLVFAQDEFASWRFIVTPQVRGRAPLQIVVSARTAAHDGVAADTALPDQTIDVRVRANITRSLGRSLGWIVAAIIGGAFAKFGETGVNVAQMLMTR